VLFMGLPGSWEADRLEVFVKERKNYRCEHEKRTSMGKTIPKRGEAKSVYTAYGSPGLFDKEEAG
jgi:hypothetical protein